METEIRFARPRLAKGAPAEWMQSSGRKRFQHLGRPQAATRKARTCRVKAGFGPQTLPALGPHPRSEGKVRNELFTDFRLPKQ